MHKILVPVDGSDHANQAMRYAMFIAEKIDAEIILLNVQPAFNTPNVKRFISKSQIQEYQQEMGNAALQEALALTKDSPIPVRTKIRIGVPGEEICLEAKENAATSIVMGYRGLGAMKGLVLGSVSYYVLHHAPCPVTIVP